MNKLIERSKQVNSKWIKLTTIPEQVCEWFITAINVNEHEFIVILGNAILFKYNIQTDAFVQLAIDTKLLCYSNHNYHIPIVFNKDKKEIYLYQDAKITAISLDKGQCKTFKLADIRYGTGFVFVNGNFHIIGNYNKHWIGTIQNDSLNCLSNTLRNECIDIDCLRAIYLPLKQSILIIGGVDENKTLNELWIYSLLSQKWKKIENVSFEGFLFGAVLTSNQRYIVILGGCDDVKVNNIYVLDMKDDNNWKIRKSNIVCPEVGRCYAVITGGIHSKNDILVMGYVKNCFRMEGFKDMHLPPINIIMLICNWYSQEMIHWLKHNKHYGIYLKHILFSLTD